MHTGVAKTILVFFETLLYSKKCLCCNKTMKRDIEIETKSIENQFETNLKNSREREREREREYFLGN